MNPDVKKRWLALLESGEYNFGRRTFYDSNYDCHCVLGVLVELALENEVFEPIVSGHGGFKRLSNVNAWELNDAICNWAGINPRDASDLANINDMSEDYTRCINYIRENL